MNTFLRLLGAGALVPSLSAQGAAPFPLDFRTVVRTADPAPGTGLTFDHFGLAPGFFDGIGGPSVDGDGNLGFHAFLGDGTPATLEVLASVWAEDGGALRLVAKDVDQAPGTPHTYVGVPLFGAAPRVHDGRLTFAGSLDGPVFAHPGIWSERFGSLDLVQSPGFTPLPGLPSAGALGGGINQVREDVVAWTLGFAPAGSSITSHQGFWVDRGSPEIVLLTGDQAPGFPEGVVFDQDHLGIFGPVEEWDVSAQGTVVFHGYVVGPGVDDFHDEGIWMGEAGALVLVAQEGAPVAGGPEGATWGSDSGFRTFADPDLLDPAVNRKGSVLFSGTIQSPDESFDNANAIVAVRNGVSDILAFGAPPLTGNPLGDPAKGFPLGFFHHGSLLGLLTDADEALILAVVGEKNPFAPTRRALYTDRFGGLTLLVGDDLPSDAIPGATVAEFNWHGSLAPAWLYAPGWVYYEARLTGPGIGAANDRALFVVQPSGEQIVVVREGEPFDVAGDGSDVRTIASFSMGAGTTRGGAKGIQLNFTDGTEALVVATPRLPLAHSEDAVTTATGGAVALELDAGPAKAGALAIVGASLSGTFPGLPLAGGAVLPLALDAFTTFSLSGAAPFSNFVQVLNAQGAGNAVFDTLGPLPPELAGLTVHFAFAAGPPFDFASNSVAVVVVP